MREADWEAAAAAKNADDVPEPILIGTPIGECQECGERFEYGRPDADVQNLDPCPGCGSQRWEKTGEYRLDDGEVMEPLKDN